MGHCCDELDHIVLGEDCKNIWNFELEKPSSTHSSMVCSMGSWKIRILRNVDNGGLACEEGSDDSFRPIYVIHLRIWHSWLAGAEGAVVINKSSATLKESLDFDDTMDAG